MVAESVDQQNRANGQNSLGLFSEAKRQKTTKALHHLPVFEHFYTPVSHYYASM